jgi:hypothetical protein
MVRNFQQKITMSPLAIVPQAERERGGMMHVPGQILTVSIWEQTKMNGMVFNGGFGRTQMNV